MSSSNGLTEGGGSATLKKPLPPPSIVIVSAAFDGKNIILHHSDGSQEIIPFTPRMLIPKALAPYLPHHLETVEAPGGLYVEAPYPTLLSLYSRLIHLTPAIIFPEPERQYLLLNGLTPFVDGLHPYYPTLSSAYFSLLKTPNPRHLGITFLENVLFLNGYARPLKLKKIKTTGIELLPLLHFNLDDTTLGGEGPLLPTSPVKIKGYFTLYTLLGRKIIKGEGIITLADALLFNLPHEPVGEIRTSSTPSFLLSSINDLIKTLLSAYHSTNGFSTGDTEHYTLLATLNILRSLPQVLLSSPAIGTNAYPHYVALVRLLRLFPHLYNYFAENVAHSERAAYYVALIRGLHVEAVGHPA